MLFHGCDFETLDNIIMKCDGSACQLVRTVFISGARIAKKSSGSLVKEQRNMEINMVSSRENQKQGCVAPKKSISHRNPRRYAIATVTSISIDEEEP